MKISLVACALLGAGADAVYTGPAAATCTACMTFDTPIPSELGGQTLTPGCYKSTAALGLTGTLTLNGSGNYVFVTPAAMAVAASGRVKLINGANADNIKWCIGAAVVMGADSTIQGSIKSGAAVTTGAGSQVYGDLSGAAAVTTGAGSCVAGDITFGAAFTKGAGAKESSGCTPIATFDMDDCTEGCDTFKTFVLGTTVLNAGCYESTAAISLIGTLTLNGNEDPNAMTARIVIKTPAAMNAATLSRVKYGSGMNPSVKWCVAGAVTLGADAIIQGSIESGAAVTTGAGSQVYGDLFGAAAVTTGAISCVVGEITAGAEFTKGAGAKDSSGCTPIPAFDMDVCTAECNNDFTTFASGTTALNAGCYESTAAISLTGTLTLNGDSPIVIKTPAAMNTATLSRVKFGTGTNRIVKWCVAGAVTLGADAIFQGSIESAAAVTTGAGSQIFAGGVTAYAAVTTGASSCIEGAVNTNGAAFTEGAGATTDKNCVLVPAFDMDDCTAGCVTFLDMPASGSTVSGSGLRCYKSTAAIALTGLTLSGDADYVFVTPAALTTAADSIVNGASGSVKWCIGAAVVLGAGSTIQGSIESGAAVNTGASSQVIGNIFATAAINTGATSTVHGYITAGAAIDTGAGAVITGSLESGAAVTTGAGSQVYGHLSGAAAVTTGAGSCVSGVLTSGTGSTMGAGATYNAGAVCAPIPAFDMDVCTAGCNSGFTTFVSGTTALAAGCYESTAAITLTGALTLNGVSTGDNSIVIKTPAAMNAAALSRVKFGTGPNPSVKWCVAGAVTLGADAVITGSIESGAAVTTGAGSQIFAGGVTAYAAVTTGASSCIERAVNTNGAAFTEGAGATTDEDCVLVPAFDMDECSDVCGGTFDNMPASGSTLSESGIHCYKSTAAIALTGLTLSGDADYVFVTPAALTTAADSVVNGAKSVKWCIGAAVALGAGSIIQGSIESGAAVNTGASSEVIGSIFAKAAINTGATSTVHGDISAGAAINTGAGACAQSNTYHGGALTRGAGATFGSGC